MTFFDFNSAAEQPSYDLIPKGTVVRVRMTIKPGGYDDSSQGWTGGYATRSLSTGSVYLNCEFVVLDGPFARRKMWSLIGLYSAKGAEWTNMGRTFIKAILNSARGINPNDSSPAAQNARRISGFADLEGIEFVGKVDWDKDQNGQDKCVIKSAVTPEHKDYAAHMNGAPAGAASAPTSSGGANAYAQATGRAPVPGRPSWAQ
ncbi:MAG: hypothetical protein E6R09_04030 [Rhodocyclaceae bacterium]|nr:MAG: hypothetical protein E6R09_04030 [Rhodocyclaceae bacterium]